MVLDYNGSTIYKIISKNTCKYFVNSTTSCMGRMFQYYKTKQKQYVRGKIKDYKIFMEVFEDGDCYVEFVKHIDGNSREEINRQLIPYRKNDLCVNKY